MNINRPVKINCIAIDDEPLALKQMESYIQKTPYLECVSCCNSAFEALVCLETQPVDLMFVDINMPDLNGMDFVKSLKQRPLVVFVTAYSEFAVDGFQVDAIDYLLKPIGYADFLKSANKAKSWYELHLKQSDLNQSQQEENLFVKSENKIVRIKIEDILYIESANEYIKIVLDNNDIITTLIRLKDFEKQLPKGTFMRIHRSFIVNLTKIYAVERNRVIIGKLIPIPIGDLFRESFQGFMEKSFKR